MTPSTILPTWWFFQKSVDGSFGKKSWTSWTEKESREEGTDFPEFFFQFFDSRIRCIQRKIDWKILDGNLIYLKMIWLDTCIHVNMRACVCVCAWLSVIIGTTMYRYKHYRMKLVSLHMSNETVYRLDWT